MPSIQERTETSLGRLVQQEVKAQMKRYAIARTREDYINSLTEVLGPALSHFYRCKLAVLNRRTDQHDKWRDQQDGFLQEFAERLMDPTKARKLDRKKAVEKALKELLQTADGRKRRESLVFQRSYKLKTLEPLPDTIQAEFESSVWEIVDTIVPT
jgi:hypothetical protein